MNHQFAFGNPNDSKLCRICLRDLMAHTKAAQCDCCSNKSECELIENILMCPTCATKHTAGRVEQVISCQDVAKDVARSANELVRITENISNETPEQLINRSRTIDSSIRWNGDFFNAETISHVEIKKAIFGNSLIPDNLKEFEYHNALMERFVNFQTNLFRLQQEQHEILQRMSGVKTTLREYGNALRKEHQDRLKEQDISYVPSAKPVKVKIPGKKAKSTNAYEKLVTTIMETRKVTRPEALKIMIDLDLHKVSDTVDE